MFTTLSLSASKRKTENGKRKTENGCPNPNSNSGADPSRLLFTVGACFLATFLFINHASATGPDQQFPKCIGGINESVDEILGHGEEEFLKHLTPVSSHYTRKVLERAQAGIEKAEGYTDTFDEADYLYWIDRAFTATSTITDTKLRVISQERDLREVTPCLHLDLFLIETMMEKVRCKIQYAFEQRRSSSIEELRGIILFLNASYKNLLEGARDNSYEDKQMWNKYTFDTAPIWCCNGSQISCEPFWLHEGGPEAGEVCQSESFSSMEDCMEASECVEWKMCPFHSDYLPPTVVGSGRLASGLQDGSLTVGWENGKTIVKSDDGTSVVISSGSELTESDDIIAIGYGCDLKVMEEKMEQLNGLGPAHSKISDALQAEYDALKSLIEQRDEFIDQSYGLAGDAINLEMWMGHQPSPGLVYFGRTKEEEREHYVRVGCNAGDGEKGAPPPELPEDEDEEDENEDIDYSKYWPPMWPEGAIKWETRGRFSIDKNESRLLREYEQLRNSWAKKRPSGSKPPEDFGFYYYFYNFMQEPDMRDWNRHQEQLAGTIVPKASDTSLQIFHVLSPLHGAVSELSRLGTYKSGVRSFARGLAYFLRRSCLNRPCNERLERILKIVLQDSCFPYTNSKYIGKEDTHKICEEDAGLD